MLDFSIQYAIKNNKYPKTLQESVDAMRKVKLKTENNNDKSNTKKNGGGEGDKSNKTSLS